MNNINAHTLNSSSDAATRSTLTYSTLLTLGAEQLKKEGLTPQPIANLCSALRLWMRVHGFNESRMVDEDFGPSFDKLLLRFSDAIATSHRSRTQRDRQEQLLRWTRVVATLKRVDALPVGFLDALRVAVSTIGMPARAVAREAGISTSTFSNWLDGKVLPRGTTVSQVPKLETVLQLPAGTLLNRLPSTRRNRYERSGQRKETTTSFTKVRRAQKRMVGCYAQPYRGRIVGEWQEVLALKTDRNRENGEERNSWRLKPLRYTAHRVQPWMLYNGLSSATAGVQWGYIASYLGWLKLPPTKGAPGIPEEFVGTLAWLADADRVIAYSKWMVGRSEGRFHNGPKVFLEMVATYLRPETGFVWIQASLRHNLIGAGPLAFAHVEQLCSDIAWREQCEKARQRVRVHLRKQVPGDRGKVRHSRSPTERASVVLNDEAPLRRLVEFTHRLESSPPPPAHRRDYFAWIRDVVLVRMMVANPLRVETYAAMTYRPDGSGNLIRTGPESFKLKLPPEAFKNQSGAASGEYEVAIDSSIAPWIHRYLSEARPNLVYANETDRFFLPAARGPRTVKPHLEELGLEEALGFKGEGLSHRLHVLTALYIDGCPGFGGHAFRHCIATDHLRRHPGDYLTVAVLLHDKLETVLQVYGHLKVQDGLNALGRDIAVFSDELRRTRGGDVV